MVTCSNCGEENPERARFCLECGSPLAGAAPAAPPVVPDEERKLDTLVFVDLVGSTALAESLDPEDVLGLLELYYGRLRAELERCGGTVEKYIGDAIVTHFGVPVAHEDDPERAVRAGLLILDTVAALNSEDPIRQIQVRIGIATGEVIVTHGNRAEEGKGIAWGDVLNTAARIESAAPVDGILVGEETYRASMHAIEYVEHEPIEAKGKSEPVRVWQAVGLREQTARGKVHDAPLVGRTVELERLTALWQGVHQVGRPAVATIIGDPGIGKSRLVAEIAQRFAEDADVLWGRCLSYGEGITYWPVIEILEGAAGILKSDDIDTVSAKLGALLERLGSDDLDQLRTMASALANLIGVPRTPRGTYSAAEISQAELHWGIRRVLELLAAQRPLVLVIEDLHWAEETLFDLLDFLREADGPVFIVGSARRELEQLRPALCTDGESTTAFFLSALGAEESEALLAELLGAHALPAGRHAELLLRNAAGNPLFLEETVRMLADSGALDGDGDLDELAVPTSLQAMIGSRLDGLSAPDKRVAQHASVVGMTFWTGAVADLHGPGADVDPSLGALEHRDFVRGQDDSSIADEREWAFKHALIKDVAYARVPKGRRAHLHVRFVDWIGAHPGAGDELVEIVAYHLEQSCKLGREVGRSETPPPVERAVDALMRAAEKAERREGIREADRYYARALDLVGDEQTEQTLELRLGRAGTLNTLGELPKANDLLTLVADESIAFGRADLRAKALIDMARIAAKQGRGSDAGRHVAEAEALAADSGDRALVVRAAYRAAYVRWWFEEAGEAAVNDLRRGLAIAEELGDTALQIEVLIFLGTLLYNVGDLAGADEQFGRCIELAGETGSLRDQARATFYLGHVRYYLGEYEEAERLGLQALAWLERTADSFYQLQNLRTLSLSAMARLDLGLAEERLRTAVPLALEIGRGALVVEIYRILVDVLIGQDRLDDARELAAFALRSVPEEDAYARAASLLIEASVRTAEGRGDVAVERFAKALELLEQQGLPLDLGEARLAFGRALHRLGDDEAARIELGRARESLTRAGALALVDAINRELAGIAEGAGVAGPLASA
jgi:class 3 adenylate cyclase/tetratricopeptide (TPR) repeat protein